MAEYSGGGLKADHLCVLVHGVRFLFFFLAILSLNKQILGDNRTR